jgi:ABC-type multidrug transport system, ATPase component
MLRISRVTKRFGSIAALSEVSFEVAAGERVALLGHNGAGKSTLMKIVLGLITATSGSLSVAGPRAREPGSARPDRLPAENVAFHPR